MHHRTRHIGFGLLGAAAVGSLTARAAGDWPSARHDARRTGVTNTIAAIETPTPYWKYFLGGTLGPTGLLAADVDGDGALELILASGDGLAAKRPATGDVVWTNHDVTFGALDGLADVDGDGTLELVAHTSSRAFLVRLTDGVTLWGEAPGEMGTLSAVRVGDISGDGRADLIIHECGCCSINSGASALAYRFAGDNASLAAPKLAWTPPGAFCGGSQSATLARMRDPNKLDFVFGTGDRLELRDGGSGLVVATMPPFGVAVQASRCMPVDIDSDNREELLCVLIDTSGTPNNGRRAYLLKYAEDPDPKLKVVWQALVGTEDGNVRIPASFVGDLDGNGTLELVLGGKDAKGAWATYVFNAGTGALLVRLDGTLPSGIAPILAGAAQALLTDQAGTLAAWRIQSDGSASMLWQLPHHEVATTIDYAASQRSSIASRLITFDQDGDGTGELVTVTSNSRALELVRASNGVPEVIGSYTPPANVSLLGVWTAPVVGKTTLAVAQSDGNAHMLDLALAPMSGNPAFGAHFGGFYATSQFRLLANHPVLGEFGDAVPGLLVVNSRGALQRLDARAATFAVPPVPLWTRERTQAPQLVRGIGPGGATGILAVEKHPGASDRVVALDAQGSLLWEREIAGVVLTDLSSGNLDGDSASDVVVEHGDPGDSILRITGLAGASGKVLWNAAPVGAGNRQPPGGSLADWNGDGTDDFVFEYERTRILNGATGALLAESPLGGAYYSPILFDVDGDGLDEITLYAGYTPAGTIAHGLDAYLWQGQADDRPLTYGALLRCDGAAVLLGGSWSVPARLSRVVAGGSKAGTTTTQILADGASYPDLAAAGAATMGQLSSPAVHANLAGDNVPVAVLGSGDGHLYGVEACTGALRFSYRIGAPVGAIAFGATDEGAEPEAILASAADGYLYALRESPLPAVATVLDTDPPHGVTDADVDTLETTDTLYATWTPVTGAESYEVAVVRDPIDGGGYVLGVRGEGGSPPANGGGFVDVGNATTAAIEGLALDVGHRYFIAVRALAPTRGLVSPDVSSDGVVVTLNTNVGSGGSGPLPGSNVYLTGRSCVYACSAAGTRGPFAGHAAAFLMVTFLARRRRANRLPLGG